MFWGSVLLIKVRHIQQALDIRHLQRSVTNLWINKQWNNCQLWKKNARILFLRLHSCQKYSPANNYWLQFWSRWRNVVVKSWALGTEHEAELYKLLWSNGGKEQQLHHYGLVNTGFRSELESEWHLQVEFKQWFTLCTFFFLQSWQSHQQENPELSIFVFYEGNTSIHCRALISISV